jgi:hypothetical protein
MIELDSSSLTVIKKRTEAFFERIKKTRIDNWSLSSFKISVDTNSFPPDWKCIFRDYIPSLQYMGSMERDEDYNVVENWSMSPLIPQSE